MLDSLNMSNTGQRRLFVGRSPFHSPWRTRQPALPRAHSLTHNCTYHYDLTSVIILGLWQMEPGEEREATLERTAENIKHLVEVPPTSSQLPMCAVDRRLNGVWYAGAFEVNGPLLCMHAAWSDM